MHAAAAAEMIESFFRISTAYACIVHLEGELAIAFVLNVPCGYWNQGSKVLALDLLPEEKKLIDRAVASVRRGIDSVLAEKCTLIS